MFKAPASRERVEKSENFRIFLAHQISPHTLSYALPWLIRSANSSLNHDLPERGRDREQKRVEKLPLKVSNFSPFKPLFFVFPTKSSPYPLPCQAKLMWRRDESWDLRGRDEPTVSGWRGRNTRSRAAAMCVRLGEKRIEKCEEEKCAVMAKQKRQRKGTWNFENAPNFKFIE